MKELGGNLVSIDPGSRTIAIALWDHSGHLLRAGFFPKKDYPAHNAWMGMRIDCAHWTAIHGEGDAVWLVVIEKPQIYNKRGPEDPNDLVDLSLMAGAVSTGWGAPVIFYKPREWKGQVPKEIHNTRTLTKLDDRETARIDWPKRKDQKHNISDALGLGLYQLKVSGIRSS